MTNLYFNLKATVKATLSPRVLYFEDLLINLANYQAIVPNLSVTKVEGILDERNLSIGTPFYKNAGYDLFNFSSPDTSDTTTFNVTKSLPLSSGEVACGTYQVGYKLKLTTALGVNGLKGSMITYSGNYQSDLFKMNYVVLSGCTNAANDGTYEITSVSQSGGFTYVFVNGNFITEGAVAISDFIMQTEETFDYCITKPIPSITKSASCTTSRITLTDNTDNRLTLQPSGVKLSPVNPVVEWTVSYPNDVDTQIVTNTTPLIFGAGTIYNAGRNIWTGAYSVSLKITDAFLLVDRSNFEAWVTLDVIGSTTMDVTCSDCGCTVRQCVVNLLDRYNELLITNPNEADRLFPKVMKLIGAWIKFTDAEDCGVDTSTYCTEITTILASTDCDCTNPTTQEVHEVIPSNLLPGTGGSGTEGTDGTANAGV